MCENAFRPSASYIMQSMNMSSPMLTTEAPGTAHSREERLRRAILDGGRAELEGEDYVNLEQVVAVAPHRPLPNER